MLGVSTINKNSQMMHQQRHFQRKFQQGRPNDFRITRKSNFAFQEFTHLENTNVLAKLNQNREYDPEKPENSKQLITTPHKMSNNLNPKYKIQIFKHPTHDIKIKHIKFNSLYKQLGNLIQTLMKKLFEYYINILQNTQTADLVATVIAERS